MSRGHGAAQRFILERADQPLGTMLEIVAREWAQSKGWRCLCVSLAFPGLTSCTCTPPRGAYETIRRAVWSLADEGAVVAWQDHGRRENKRVTFIELPRHSLTPPAAGPAQASA